MGLDIIGYREIHHVRIGYGRFKDFREWCLRFMPLDFQLQYQLWLESRLDGIMPKPPPYIDYRDFPDWRRTFMRADAWEFFSHSDGDGGWEDAQATARFLTWLRERTPIEGTDYDRMMQSTLDELIELFGESDRVEFT